MWYAYIFCRTNKAMDIQGLGDHVILSVDLQLIISGETIPSLTKRGNSLQGSVF